MKNLSTPLSVPSIALFSALAVCSTGAHANGFLDIALKKRLAIERVDSVTPPPAQDPDLVELGRNLFYEKEISGRRNMACSTCHSVVLGSADAQSQSRGQGAIGLGPSRRSDDPDGVRVPGSDLSFQFLSRNTLSLWNRGVAEWTTMFWDGRLEGSAAEGFVSPAGDDSPQEFSSALAFFPILPITPDEEMRGFPGQPDVFGNPNELADLTNGDFVEIWDLVVARVVNTEGYEGLLQAAFPGQEPEDFDIVDFGEAVGAFMSEAFTALDSPFDRYLAGDNDALSDDAKRGALLFYGRANCSACHAGALQTDFDFHNIAAPQVGTGRGENAPLDIGRAEVTGSDSDNFKFRTPSLRNITLEPPYMHNGAFADLEDAVRHHLDPAASLAAYDDTQVEPELVGTFQDDPALIDTLLSTLDPELAHYRRNRLSDSDVDNIMAFLESLTDPSSTNLLDLVPDSLPSGLTLAD